MPFPRLNGYLLLKRVAQDSLGSVFRAGRTLEEEGIGDLALLRVFDGAGLSGEALAAAFADRKKVVGHLSQNPFLTPCSEGLLAEGKFFLTYPYQAARDLTTLLRQAQERFNPVPADYALLISERLAQALLPLSGTREVHGFLVPEMAYVTVEGKVQLLGLEVALGLRRMVTTGPLSSHFAPYLSPETRSGEVPREVDDVYSLGALLLALLTGATPPEDCATHLDEVLAQTRLAEDDEPLPQPLQDLLQRSLGPVEQRLSKVEAWHKALTQTMDTTGLQATPFNLAVFMHRLLDQEMEAEDAEIEAEREAARQAQPAPPPEVATESPAPPSVPRPQPVEMPQQQATLAVEMPTAEDLKEPTPKPSKNRVPGLALVTLLVIALGAGGYFFVFRKAAHRQNDRAVAAAPSADTTSVSAANGPPVQSAPAAAVTPTPQPSVGDLEKRVSKLLNKGTKELDEKYLREMNKLQKQLAEARQASADATREAAEAQHRASAKPTKTSAQPSAHPGDASSNSQVKSQRPARPEVQNRTPGKVAGNDARQSTTPGHPSFPPGKAPSAPAASSAVSTPASGANQPSTETPPTAGKSAPLRDQSAAFGDIAAPGPGVIPPKLKRFSPPDYPQAAVKAKVEGVVILGLLVDEEGHITQVRFLKQVPENVGINEAAKRAAQRALFEPATRNGRPVKMWYTLTIPFQL